MLREGFTTPDNVQKKDLFFNHVTRSEVDLTIRFNEQRAKRSQKKEVEDYNGKIYKEHQKTLDSWGSMQTEKNGMEKNAYASYSTKDGKNRIADPC